MVRRAVGRYAGAVVATFRGKPLPLLADRIWNVGQSLWILALPALIVLKLTGVITWSWWWVLAPLWIIGIVVLPFLCLLVAPCGLAGRDRLQLRRTRTPRRRRGR